MTPDYDMGDILIRRVANGWVVVTGSDVQEGQTTVFVYEDKEIPAFVEESLCNLLQDQFECYMQSKYSAGIKISFTTKTLEEEEDEADSTDETIS